MNLIAKTLAGSRLYRLDGPDSDVDVKGIFLPTLEDCLLDRAPKTQSSKEGDTEWEAFSLQRFVELAARGEDVAMVMLHSNKVIVDSPIYQYLRQHRNRFYTKQMAGSAGFCKSMCAKYSLRADRMDSVIAVIKVLNDLYDEGVARLSQVWDRLPDLPHTRKFENPTDRGLDKRIYEVAGKGLPATITPHYALDILTKLRDSYGARVNLTREMGGADVKAISHSFRVGYQLRAIYLNGDFSFPLPENDFIRAVKEGKLNYVTDKLDEKLNDLITEVEALSAASSYPESVDREWMDQIVLDAYEQDKRGDLL